MMIKTGLWLEQRDCRYSSKLFGADTIQLVPTVYQEQKQSAVTVFYTAATVTKLFWKVQLSLRIPVQKQIGCRWYINQTDKYWNGMEKEYVDSGIRYPAYDISPDIEAIKAIEQAERQNLFDNINCNESGKDDNIKCQAGRSSWFRHWMFSVRKVCRTGNDHSQYGVGLERNGEFDLLCRRQSAEKAG